MTASAPRKWSLWPVSALVALFALLPGPAFGDGGLLVTVVPVKQTFVLGEPVYVDLLIKNITKEAVLVSDDPLMLGAVIRISPPGGGEAAGWSRGGGSFYPKRLVSLASGESFTDRALISHDWGKCNFPVAGAYQVWAQYRLGGMDAISERVEVVVDEPSGTDAKAKELFFSEAGQSFVHPGGYFFRGNQGGITPAVADFERIVNDYPTSTYAPYAAYYLALAKSYPGLRYSLGSDPIPADYGRAIELAQLAEAKADFPLKAEARLLQAECYFALGDRVKASSVLQSVGALPGLLERRRAEALVAKLAQPAQ